jgi:allophanate hydrolase
MITRLNFASLRGRRPTETIAQVYRRIAKRGIRPIWIELVPEADALARALALENDPQAKDLPLYGLPFAVKDNIDVAGLPTTAGCPAYAYTPTQSATVVERLLAAGAILIGKTNLDQFATGLVGVRSPYGACGSVYDERYISGGSSAGSAVAVAAGLVAFSLGTDTAGSGRVPAAFNNIVGWKPTRGSLSAAGVVPACRTLDCVSVFTVNNADALEVMRIAAAHDPRDPFSRTGQAASPWLNSPFRFGVPPREQLEFFGDHAAAELFRQAEDRLTAIGGTRVEIDFTLFRATADLLYSGPWVAERLTAIKDFFTTHEAELEPTVRTIIGGAARYTAVDTFTSIYQLAALRQKTLAEWAHMDVMLVPTAGATYTIAQVQAEPIKLNTNLGYYTNFVNLLDLAAVATPAGFRPNGLPFGVTLIGPAWTDTALLTLAARFNGETLTPAAPPNCVSVAVLGAHLSGQPLNWQLTERGARLIKTCRTAKGYRFYALSGAMPAKPGLVRDAAVDGPGIEVEVWAVPEDKFGGFVAAIPPPLSIGSAELDDGSIVKCFLCEPYALETAEEITTLGGWRNYLARGR